MCYVTKAFKGKNLFNVQDSPIQFNGTEDKKFINGFKAFTVTNFREIISCVIWESKETKISKIILKKKKRVPKRIHENLILRHIINFSNYDSTILVRKQTYAPMRQIKNPEIDPHIYDQLIYSQ